MRWMTGNRVLVGFKNAIGLAVVLSGCGTSVTVPSESQAETPKVVRRAKPPLLKRQPIMGKAELPDEVAFGMMCDVAGEIQTGDWKLIGKVVAHEPGLVTFRTEEFQVRGKVRDEEQEGHLAYRLPEGLELPLAVGDPITLMHDHGTDQKRVERDIHLSSAGQLILATSHQHDDTPPKSADRAEVLFEGAPGGRALFFWSDPGTDDLTQALKEVGEISSPVSLRAQEGDDFEEIDASRNSVTTISLDGVEYHFVVLSSHYVAYDSHGQDSHGHESDDSDESPDQASAEEVDAHYHSLECLLIRAAR